MIPDFFSLRGCSFILAFVGFASLLQAEAVSTRELLPAPPDGYCWQAVPELSDEFGGQNLDATKWAPSCSYWKGREPSRFDPQNVLVRDGLLELRSTTTITNLSQVQNPTNDVWVHSACVSSKQPSAFYGFYEARIKASRLSMTSSFWFQGKYSEIDVVEELGASQKHPEKGRLMLMNSHYYPQGWKHDKSVSASYEMAASAADTFHVFAVWWKDKDTLWLYHNGQKVAAIKTGGPFLEPMYLFFDTEVFVWEGLPTVESLKQPEINTMYVDWVRSWRLVKNQD